MRVVCFHPKVPTPSNRGRVSRVTVNKMEPTRLLPREAPRTLEMYGASDRTRTCAILDYDVYQYLPFRKEPLYH